MPGAALTTDAVGALALGCEILGSGGGGTTRTARLILQHHLAVGPPVYMVADLPPQTHVACVGAYGSATLMLENLPRPSVFARALAGVDNRHPVDAVLPLEVGGVNGVLAGLVAATCGLPLVDADPMARAFTRLADTALARHVPLRSIVFAGPAGQVAHLEADTPDDLEAALQALLPAVGGWGAVVAFAGRAEAILPYAVHGSLSLALSLGEAALAATRGDPSALLDMSGVRLIVDGWVTEVRRHPGVEVRGVASLSRAASHRSGRQPARLDFANEYLLLIVAGSVAAQAPDILCVLDAGWNPVPAEELRAGQQVRVLTIEAPADLRAAHERSGAFGIAARGYQPVTDR